MTGTLGSSLAAIGCAWPGDCICVGLEVRLCDLGVVYTCEAVWLRSSV